MIDRRELPNPFSIDVVPRPELPLKTDVLRIHRHVFNLCQKAYEFVATESQSTSVLLHGEAGCGKTHLLSRFRKWLSGAMDSAPSIPPALFVAVLMETAPSQIWRHLRHRLAEELTRRNADGTCELDRILAAFAARSHSSIPESLENASIEDMKLDLTRVLEHFAARNHRQLCRAWLAGDSLSDADLLTLNLPQTVLEDVEDDYAEDCARRMVKAVVRLCAPAPVVICFDQVEALGIAQKTKNYAAFSQMGASLVHGTSNSLLVSTVLATFLVDLKETSSQADFYKISMTLADIEPLDWELSNALIAARLALIPELAGETRIAENRLRAYFDKQHGRCNPRQLIHWARGQFAQWQERPEEPPVPQDEFLRDTFHRARTDREAQNNPADTDAVLAKGLALALELQGKAAKTRTTGLSVGSGSTGIHVEYANQVNMRSLAAALRKLLDNPPANATLCLIRDARLPISKNATQSLNYIEKIKANGGRLLSASPEALAALDAMHHLLAQATSGNLSCNGDTISDGTVREWLARNLPAPVEKLAAEIFGEEPQRPPDLREATLLELVRRRKVVPAGDAARETGLTQEQIESYARTRPLHFRWFGGSCPVVCLAVAQAAAQEPVGNARGGGDGAR